MGIWIKCTQAKFEFYGVTITTQRQLSDGEYIMHATLQSNPDFFLAVRFDADVKILTEAEMEAILDLETLEA